MNSSEIVQLQLEAYNAHNLEPFIAFYSDTARLIRMPSSEVLASGKAQISELYRTKVFSMLAHRAELLDRTASANFVVDHERVYGLTPQPFEAIAVYQVIDKLIQNVWIFSNR